MMLTDKLPLAGFAKPNLSCEEIYTQTIFNHMKNVTSNQFEQTRQGSAQDGSLFFKKM